MNHRIGFSRREWLFVIVILMMAEYWLTTFSYNFSGDEKLLNYISFAATISALLLSVIAIIYGFVQTESAQRVSDSLTSQIDNLISASGELNNSKLQLENQLNRVDEIAEKLDSLRADVGGYKNDVAAAMQRLNEKPLDDLGAAAPLDRSSIARTLLGRTTYVAEMLSFALFQYLKIDERKRPKILVFLDNKFARPVADAESAEVGDSKSADLSIGRAMTFSAVFEVLSALRAFDIISIEKDVMTVTDDIFKVLEQCSQNAQASDSGYVLKGIEAIKKSLL